MKTILVSIGVLLLLAATTGAARGDEPTPQQLEFFEKTIRPLLAQNCHKCHSSKAKRLRGGLTLENRQGLLSGGDSGPALVPGHPEKSRVFKAVRYDNPDLRMPPRKKLTDRQIAAVKTWIEMGAPWPKTDVVAKKINKGGINLKERAKHWAFQAPKRRSLPQVKDKSWPISPIDFFILAKLEANGLQPNPPADMRTLLRRIYFDLIGLPPAPTEIKEFLKEAEAKPQAALAAVVNRLLDSPHYGERWARHWLDLVRFAETHGHEFDFEIPDAWRYRDYVIRAINADVPYDQFVREHIAGDLLPSPRLHPTEKFNESILGTGFWFLGEGKHSPVDVRGDQADRLDNQIDVFGKTFLGLTVACARCHDHKFDAITQRDYYSLVGYLQSSRYHRAFFQNPEPLNDRIVRLQNLRTEIANITTPQSPPAAAGGSAGTANDKYVLFEDFRTPSFKNWYITGTAFGAGPSKQNNILLQGNQIRSVAPHIAHSGLISNRLQGNLRSKTFIIKKSQVHYRVAGRGSRIRLILDGLQLIRNPIYGGLEFQVNHGDAPRWHSQNIGMWIGHRAYIEVLDDGGGWVAVDDIVFSNEGRPPTTPKTPLYQNVKLPNEKAEAKIKTLAAEYHRIESEFPGLQRAIAMADGSPVDEFLHIRGSHKNPGNPVPRRFLEVFDGNKPAAGTDDGSGRLELAERLVDPKNPFVARVMVNRIWKHHFAEGIVRSVDNFGVLGQKPTHPELLDWLATEFMRRKWSIKEMHRLMVLSRTYQMSSRPRSLAAPRREDSGRGATGLRSRDAPRREGSASQIDPENKLLHRMPIKRLEGEIIRDALLAISGRLDRKMFGPGVMPHLTPFMAGRGRPRKSGPLDGEGRRSIYINVRRNFLTPMFLVFDYPVPFSTMGRRSVSNVPAQALTMMNNRFVLQQTKLWSQKVLADKGLKPQKRIAKMYVKAFGRPPSGQEVPQMLDFLQQQSRLYGKENDPRAWHDLCHVVVNLKEFIYVQ